MDKIELKKQVSELNVRAGDLKIITDQDYISASEFLLQIKEAQKKINSYFDPIIEAQHKAHKEAISQKKRAEAPLIRAESSIKSQIAVFLEEREKQRQEKEKELREKAQKEAEERLLEEAESLEKSGQKAEAEELISTPVEAPVIIAQNNVPKVDGISSRKTWKFRVVNADLIPRQYLTVDEVKIGGVVRATQGNVKIPGVEIYPESVIAAGKR